MLGAIAALGFAAAGLAVALALTSDELASPGVRAALLDWVILAYVLAGVVAWSRRPGSRLGPLMVAAGFASAVGSLSWSNASIPFTIGELFDFLPPVLFLHVFLAYPTGRLRSRLERGLVATGYATALGLELVRLLLGGFGPKNLLAVVDAPGAATAVTHVLLSALSVLSLAGIGVLALRRWRAGRALRRSLDLLVNAFALGLVMVAVLFLSIVFGGPGVEAIRRLSFAVIGMAPIVFLFGLVGARLARSAVGDLVVELRTNLAPAELRDALARGVRDPSLTLVYWLPQYGSWADHEGRPVELPEQGAARAMTVIDQDGDPVAARLNDRALTDEPELLESVRAAAGIALEHGRLQAELRARLEEVEGSRARIVAATQEERQRLERNLHDGAQQRLIALSLELGRLLDKQGTDVDTSARRGSAARDRRVARGAPRCRPRPSPRGRERARLGGRARAARRGRARSRPPRGRRRRTTAGAAGGGRVLPRRGASRTSASTQRRPR